MGNEIDFNFADYNYLSTNFEDADEKLVKEVLLKFIHRCRKIHFIQLVEMIIEKSNVDFAKNVFTIFENEEFQCPRIATLFIDNKQWFEISKPMMLTSAEWENKGIMDEEFKKLDEIYIEKELETKYMLDVFKNYKNPDPFELNAVFLKIYSDLVLEPLEIQMAVSKEILRLANYHETFNINLWLDQIPKYQAFKLQQEGE